MVVSDGQCCCAHTSSIWQGIVMSMHMYKHTRMLHALTRCPILSETRWTTGGYRLKHVSEAALGTIRNRVWQSRYSNGSNLRRHSMEAGKPSMSVKVQSDNAGVSAHFGVPVSLSNGHQNVTMRTFQLPPSAHHAVLQKIGGNLKSILCWW